MRLDIGYFVGFTDILEFGVDAGVGTHEQVEEFGLFVGEVIISELMTRHMDLHTGLGLMFLFEVDIPGLGEDMESRVGLQHRQVHDLAELIDMEHEAMT